MGLCDVLKFLNDLQTALVFYFVFLDGKFGAYMQIHIQNDGPVTIELSSPAGPTDPKQVCC